MIRTPMPFEEAIRFLLDKEQLPAEWDSAMWRGQEADFRTKAFFSAQVENARFLDRAQGLIFDYLAKTTEKVVGPDGVERVALRTAGREHFVKRMRDFMIAEGMARHEEFASANQKDVEDLRSLARLRLIFDTNVRQAYGYGQWKQGMAPGALRAFPAARLIRDRGVKEPRLRHQIHLGEVRLKTDARWADYHNAREIGGFGVPWGPYGFNSGVTQEDVSREEARELGLPVDRVAPVPGKLTDGTEASTRGMDPALKAKLLAELRGGPKPADPREAARQAAAGVRKAMLQRGMDAAILRGDHDKAESYREALADLKAAAVEVREEGEKIVLAVTPAPVVAKAGEDIGAKLVPDAKVPATAQAAHRTAMAAIDAVHGDGPLSELAFIFKRGGGSTRAFYDPAAVSHQIALQRYDTPENSIVHEVGHWLDHIAFHQGSGTGAPYGPAQLAGLFTTIEGEWGSYGDEFRGFMDAVKATQAYRDIQADFRLSDRSRKYLLSNHELFARAYAQWIAVESGDKTMLGHIEKELERARTKQAAMTQWEWDDFNLVREEIRSIFAKRKWLRK